MAQVKFYGRRDVWGGRQREVSDVLHECLVSAWQLPPEKRFHRFLLVEPEDLVCPQRSEDYLIVEVFCFEGRTDEAKRALVRACYDRAVPALGIDRDDLELVVVETPRVNWGVRGVNGDELHLGYRVEV